MMQEEFEDFWLDIVDYAYELGVEPWYVEEEFCILGELIKVKPPQKNEFINQVIQDMDLDDIINTSDKKDTDDK